MILKIRCRRCRDEGFVREPCPECGALKIKQPAGPVVAYMAGSLFGEDEAPHVAKDKRARAKAF